MAQKTARLYALLAFALCLGYPMWPSPPRHILASGGVLDLRSWDFDQDGNISLSGVWDFAPGRLLGGSEAASNEAFSPREVPDEWKGGAAGQPRQGAGTYRLRVLLPKSRPHLAIKYSTVATAFELEVGGYTIARAGRPSLDQKDAVAAYRPGVARLPETEDNVDILVRVSNHEYRVGGMWRAFVLGRADRLESEQLWKNARAVGMAAALIIASLLFSFFITGTGMGPSFLLFCLISFIAALRSLVTGEYVLSLLFPQVSFDLLIRLEYLTAFASFPLWLVFIDSLFPGEVDHRVARAIAGVGLSFLVLLFVAPLPILTVSIYPYYAVVVVSSLFSLWIIIRASARRREGAIVILIGGLILAMSALNDILFSNFLVKSVNLYPLGMIIAIGSLSFALASRYKGMQASLAEALEEKELLFKEVHHRVKNSLQIVSSIASLQAHRASDSASVEAYEAMRRRIRAISLVHEQLYALSADETVDIGAYVRDLALQLSESFGMETGVLSVDASAVRLSAGLCSDLGLVITELVSNSFKYAMNSEGGCRVRITVESPGSELLLAVEDEGPGFPADFSAERTTGLGFRLIMSIAKKRDASVKISSGPGGKVSIRMPFKAAFEGGLAAQRKKERAI
jgi:Signal transduction histidine kinase